MKKRNGFVSNSSSSSFIIKFNLNKKGKIEIDPSKMEIVKKGKDRITIRVEMPQEACYDFADLLKKTGIEYEVEEQ